MKRIDIRAEKPYAVLLGRGILDEAGAEIRKVTEADRCVIVADSNVAPLYADRLTSSLRAAGIHAERYDFPAGERSKCGTTYLSLLEFLAEQRLTRSDLLIALGGGVTGDLTGFAAATYLRGIAYVQIPTSLLAMVDSSVGGKTAIDLSAGKNLAGAFCQPRLVLCDVDLLDTLPRAYFIDGCGEVVKYAVLGDPELLDILLRDGADFPREDVIDRCIRQKERFVAEDEFDRGLRQQLNLGHTLGHAVELKSDYTLSHGRAVAVGLCLMTDAAEKAGLCPEKEARRILCAVQALGLPSETGYSLSELCEAARTDKKRRGDAITCVIPRAIGRCELRTMPFTDFVRFCGG